MPPPVAKKYPNLRCIIDYTEVKIPHPKTPSAQQLAFSNYKNCNTANAWRTLELSAQLRVTCDCLR